MKSSHHKYRTIAILFVSILSGTALFIRCSQKPSTYLNLNPAVQYTGVQSCQPCHKKIYQSFLETGMGKSFYEPDTGKIIESFGVESLVYDEKEDFYYLPYWQNNEMFVKEFRLKNQDTVYQRNEKIDFIVGSGHQTRSYILQRKDYLYEVPITWYVNKQIWDLSPGYDEVNTRFSREIGEECLTCHTGYIEHIEGSKNRYRKVALGIDCEKCHGPGEEHIRLTEGGQLIDVGEETDYSIVNPGKLPISKQFDVCQQCHLQGVNVFKDGKEISDFRPGMDLHEIYEVFIEQHPDQNAFGIASHAERLQQSQCFIQSNGKLTCTTCHDPHKSVNITDEKVYINQCQKCHQNQQVSR
ncbi:MAG: multiheme c-type cytochrome [Bacteroidia bacterium]